MEKPYARKSANCQPRKRRSLSVLGNLVWFVQLVLELLPSVLNRRGRG